MTVTIEIILFRTLVLLLDPFYLETKRRRPCVTYILLPPFSILSNFW